MSGSPIEPKLPANGQFIVAWRTILRRPALHAVREEDFGTCQPNLAQHSIHERARSANEWAYVGVFGRAGSFTDEHDGCGHWTLTWYSSCAALAEPAFLTPQDSLVKRIEAA